MTDIAKVEDAELQRRSLEIDGDTLDVLHSADMSEMQWMEAKAYFQAFPDEARRCLEEETNPDLIRRRDTLNVIADVWRKTMDGDQDDFARKIKALEEDVEFKRLFDALKEYRWDEVADHFEDKELMMKVSRRMGGVPREAKLKAEKLRKRPLTLQEACKFGDIKAVQRYLSETEQGGREVDAEDHRGITCLGYAVGANRMNIAKLLIESKADATRVDDRGDSALHFAAAYGRKDMLEYLLGLGLNLNATNSLGMTPLACATRNKQKVAIQFLAEKGAA
eukprot:CAMPEP_0176058958 /NCGR_PEP_ID=MMETSP0120_2-20121206/29379_1 /TAXON_ID=160619 /ORGANISM="Kryptoperidinium foliaceum, Strain CCMP 1326" /LENGTH=278 /DNA_ID=CAMNT_0017392491 /DNA_START=59 /DNA_END=895 /DNA_ORIENTATION=-